MDVLKTLPYLNCLHQAELKAACLGSSGLKMRACHPRVEDTAMHVRLSMHCGCCACHTDVSHSRNHYVCWAKRHLQEGTSASKSQLENSFGRRICSVCPSVGRVAFGCLPVCSWVEHTQAAAAYQHSAHHAIICSTALPEQQELHQIAIVVGALSEVGEAKGARGQVILGNGVTRL
jgi:hypothetical protein